MIKQFTKIINQSMLQKDIYNKSTKENISKSKELLECYENESFQSKETINNKTIFVKKDNKSMKEDCILDLSSIFSDNSNQASVKTRNKNKWTHLNLKIFNIISKKKKQITKMKRFRSSKIILKELNLNEKSVKFSFLIKPKLLQNKFEVNKKNPKAIKKSSFDRIIGDNKINYDSTNSKKSAKMFIPNFNFNKEIKKLMQKKIQRRLKLMLL